MLLCPSFSLTALLLVLKSNSLPYLISLLPLLMGSRGITHFYEKIVRCNRMGLPGRMPLPSWYVRHYSFHNGVTRPDYSLACTLIVVGSRPTGLTSLPTITRMDSKQVGHEIKEFIIPDVIQNVLQWTSKMYGKTSHWIWLSPCADNLTRLALWQGLSATTDHSKLHIHCNMHRGEYYSQALRN
jgi:hypothetical protein